LETGRVGAEAKKSEENLQPEAEDEPADEDLFGWFDKEGSK